MFDTIRCIYNVMLDIEVFQQLQKRNNVIGVSINEILNRQTGELTYTVTIKGHQIHYIKYFSSTATLIFEVSIPKYLKGSNVNMVNENDVLTFYTAIKNDFKKMFDLNIDIDEVKCSRLHVCYNIDITKSGFNMVEWLSFILKQKIPYKPKKSPHYDDDNLTGVTFKPNSKSQHRITFYDKESEMRENHKKAGLAKGILRIEVKTSTYEMMKFSRNIKDLLTKDYFNYIMNKYKVNNLLKAKYDEEQGEIPYHWLINSQNYKVHQLEKLVGFIQIHNDLKEHAPSLYEQKTYRNRKESVSELNALIKQKNKASKKPRNVPRIDI